MTAVHMLAQPCSNLEVKRLTKSLLLLFRKTLPLVIREKRLLALLQSLSVRTQLAITLPPPCRLMRLMVSLLKTAGSSLPTACHQTLEAS